MKHIFTAPGRAPARAARLLVVLCALAGLLAGCGLAPSSAVAPPPLSASGGQAASSTTSGHSAGANKERYTMIEMTMEDGGVIQIELDSDAAPITVQNFVDLVNDEFYDGLTFHRVIDGFMIQGGCPDGTGTGGPGHQIKGEFAVNGWDNPISHVRGVISMARGGHDYDSAGSQFFITNGDASGSLDGQYAAFGRVVSGMEVVDAIATVPTTMGGDGQMSKPIDPVVIKTVRVVGEDGSAGGNPA